MTDCFAEFLRENGDRVLMAALVGFTASLAYALALNTRPGKALAQRRTYLTVIAGHLLMATTAALVSPWLGLAFVVWSAIHGLPLVVRSWVLEWQKEQAYTAALRARRPVDETL